MAKRPRIAVVGSANIDLTTFTNQFPKPGETIFGQRFDLGFGGKGANQAVAARLCGAEVFMVARVGSDLFGPATIENFRKQGIDPTHVKQVEGLSSGVAPIFVEPNGQNRILVVKGANDALKPADVDAAAETLKSADCIVLQFEIPVATVYYTIEFARKLLFAGIRPSFADLEAHLKGKSRAETANAGRHHQCPRLLGRRPGNAETGHPRTGRRHQRPPGAGLRRPAIDRQHFRRVPGAGLCAGRHYTA